MINNQRLARLIDLVPFISQNQGIALTELAKKFGVSTAELEKDLFLLWCCGLPGHSALELMDFEFESGYVTVRNADELRVPRKLTQSEIAALIVGLQLLDAGNNQLIQSLQAKLRRELTAQIDYHPSSNETKLPEIQEAISNGQMIRIQYNFQERRVIPFEIYSEAGSDYLRAFCKESNAWRTFKLRKIERITRLAERELPPADVPANSTKESMEIRTHSEARRVREYFGGIDSIEIYSREWFIQSLLAMGGAAEGVDREVRDEVRRRAEVALALHAR